MAEPTERENSDLSILLTEIDERLRRRYGTQSLGNLPDPLDELIFIQLSIRTPGTTYLQTYEDLKAIAGNDWEELLQAPDEVLLSVLEPGGMARVKLDRIRSQLIAIRERFGGVTLEPLFRFSDQDAEAFLLSLPGVGPKAARCVMLYSLKRQVFPVDSHCLRILTRLGIADPNLDRKAAHDVLQPRVPLDIRHALHVNLIHHGRDLCTARSPDCPACPLLDLCPTGQSREGGAH